MERRESTATDTETGLKKNLVNTDGGRRGGRKKKATRAERKREGSVLPLVCMKVEASSLGCLLSLTFCCSAARFLPLYLSQVIMFTQAAPAISPLSNPLLFFPPSFLSPLSLSFSCRLEICEACSSAPASVNPLPKHLSNARNLEMLKKNHTTTTTTTVLNAGLVLARVAAS